MSFPVITASKGSRTDDSNTFGPTAENHKDAMVALWGFAANIAIFIMLYSYRKLCVYVHGAYFLIATIITLATSIPIITYTGIISKDATITSKYSTTTLNLHYSIGIACLISIGFITLVGILTKMLNFLQAKSNTILQMKKIH